MTNHIQLRHCKVCNQMTNHKVLANDFDDMIRTDYICLKCQARKKKELEHKGKLRW